MDTLEAHEFYGGDLVEALKEAGFNNAYVMQTGGGTATIYASHSEDSETDDVDEMILGGPGAYHWNDPNKSVFTTDEFYIGEEQYYTNSDTEKGWDPYSRSVTAGAAIADMVALFVEVSKHVNETVRNNPNPNA